LKTLLVFPGIELKNLYRLDKSFYFIDESGWWFLDDINKKRVCIYLSEIKISYSDFDINLRKQIYQWIPLWTRWVGDSTNYENLIIETIVKIQKINSLLKKYEINMAIFHTGVPHHIDTSILNISCENCKIQQIYLYAQVFDNRLIPLSILDGIKNRKLISYNISKIDYNNIIDDFLINKLLGNAPKTNSIVSIKKKIYVLAILKI
jgi:hypothetical protein